MFHSLLFDMQHDHVLKKFNFYFWPTLRVDGEDGWLGGGLRPKYLLPCCCIRDSLSFDMQHDYVLKQQ